MQGSSAGAITAGILLTLASQIFQAVRLIMEESLLAKMDLHPMEVSSASVLLKSEHIMPPVAEKAFAAAANSSYFSTHDLIAWMHIRLCYRYVTSAHKSRSWLHLFRFLAGKASGGQWAWLLLGCHLPGSYQGLTLVCASYLSVTAQSLYLS